MSILNPKKVYDSIEGLKTILVNQNAEFLTIEETSNFLKIKSSSLYNLVYKKQIPHYKPNGKKLYFEKNELIEWVTSSKVKSIDQVNSEYVQESKETLS